MIRRCCARRAHRARGPAGGGLAGLAVAALRARVLPRSVGLLLLLGVPVKMFAPDPVPSLAILGLAAAGWRRCCGRWPRRRSPTRPGPRNSDESRPAPRDDLMPRRTRGRLSWSGGRAVALAAFRLPLPSWCCSRGSACRVPCSPVCWRPRRRSASSAPCSRGCAPATSAGGVAARAAWRPRRPVARGAAGGRLLSAARYPPPRGSPGGLRARTGPAVRPAAADLLDGHVRLRGGVPSRCWRCSRPRRRRSCRLRRAETPLGPNMSNANPDAVLPLRGVEEVGQVLALATLALSAAAVGSLVRGTGRAGPRPHPDPLGHGRLRGPGCGVRPGRCRGTARAVGGPGRLPGGPGGAVRVPVAVAVAVLRPRPLRRQGGRWRRPGLRGAHGVLLGVDVVTAVGVVVWSQRDRTSAGSGRLGRCPAFVPLRGRPARRCPSSLRRTGAAVRRARPRREGGGGPSTTPDRMLTSLAAWMAARCVPLVAVELRTGDGGKATGEAGRRPDAGSEPALSFESSRTRGTAWPGCRRGARRRRLRPRPTTGCSTTSRCRSAPPCTRCACSLQRRASCERLVTRSRTSGAGPAGTATRASAPASRRLG